MPDAKKVKFSWEEEELRFSGIWDRLGNTEGLATFFMLLVGRELFDRELVLREHDGVCITFGT